MKSNVCGFGTANVSLKDAELLVRISAVALQHVQTDTVNIFMVFNLKYFDIIATKSIVAFRPVFLDSLSSLASIK